MVSNHYVRSVVLRIGISCIVVLVAATLSTAFLVHSINRSEVRTAHQIMEDAAQLRVQISTFSDVLDFSRKYNGEAGGTRQNMPCLESECLVTVAPNKNDFWERHPKLAYAAERISRRGWNFSVLVWVEDGKMTAIEQWFGYLTPRNSFFVITEVTRPHFRLYGNPSYRLHPTFAVYPSPKHFNVWVNPTASQEKEMLRLNLDCVLRVSGCKGIPDMVPAAWSAYEAERRVVDPNGFAADPEDR